MSTPIQLFFIALGIIIGLHSVLKGSAIASLPGGWFLAEDSEFYLEIWLGACLVFGILLIANKMVYSDDRNSKTSH
jgi:hypothetical protein